MIKFKQYITEMIHGPTDSLHDHRTGTTNIIMSKHYDIKKHFTPEHEEAVKHYTRDGYHDINKILRNGEPIEYNRNYLKIKHLDDITRHYEAPHDFHVYSGIKFDPTEGKEHKEPFKAHIKQFTSASLRPEVALSNAETVHKEIEKNKVLPLHHMLKIHIPKGTKHGAYVQPFSTYQTEQEFLLPRNLKLMVHHEPEKASFSPSANDDLVRIWHASIKED